MRIAEPTGPVFYVSFRSPHMPKKEQFEAGVIVCACCADHAEVIACQMVDDCEDMEVAIMEATETPFACMPEYQNRVLDLADVQRLAIVAVH